jgi:hypothetical protein
LIDCLHTTTQLNCSACAYHGCSHLLLQLVDLAPLKPQVLALLRGLLLQLTECLLLQLYLPKLLCNLLPLPQLCTVLLLLSNSLYKACQQSWLNLNPQK